LIAQYRCLNLRHGVFDGHFGSRRSSQCIRFSVLEFQRAAFLLDALALFQRCHFRFVLDANARKPLHDFLLHGFEHLLE
jgi:hypothetical protein